MTGCSRTCRSSTCCRRTHSRTHSRPGAAGPSAAGAVPGPPAGAVPGPPAGRPQWSQLGYSRLSAGVCEQPTQPLRTVPPSGTETSPASPRWRSPPPQPPPEPRRPEDTSRSRRCPTTVGLSGSLGAALTPPPQEPSWAGLKHVEQGPVDLAAPCGRWAQPQCLLSTPAGDWH